MTNSISHLDTYFWLGGGGYAQETRPLLNTIKTSAHSHMKIKT